MDSFEKWYSTSSFERKRISITRSKTPLKYNWWLRKYSRCGGWNQSESLGTILASTSIPNKWYVTKINITLSGFVDCWEDQETNWPGLKPTPGYAMIITLRCILPKSWKNEQTWDGTVEGTPQAPHWYNLCSNRYSLDYCHNHMVRRFKTGTAHFVPKSVSKKSDYYDNPPGVPKFRWRSLLGPREKLCQHVPLVTVGGAVDLGDGDVRAMVVAFAPLGRLLHLPRLLLGDGEVGVHVDVPHGGTGCSDCWPRLNCARWVKEQTDQGGIIFSEWYGTWCRVQGSSMRDAESVSEGGANYTRMRNIQRKI